MPPGEMHVLSDPLDNESCLSGLFVSAASSWCCCLATLCMSQRMLWHCGFSTRRTFIEDISHIRSSKELQNGIENTLLIWRLGFGH